MDIIRTLFSTDRTAIRRWFETESASKRIVAMLFLVIFSDISLGLYALSGAFFRSLASFDSYGFATAGYIIHAAIVIILWLALGSSIAASTGVLLSPGSDLTYLLTLPVPHKRIVQWMFVKTIAANSALTLFVFAPVMVSFAAAFHLVSVGFFLRTAFVFICIVLISSAAGMAVTLLGARWLKDREYGGAVIGIIGFFLAMIALLRVIFPPELARLYSATAAEFALLFPALPLSNPSIPTFWFADMVTSGISVYSALAVLLTAAVVSMSYGIQISRFVPVLTALRSRLQSGNIPAFWNTLFLRTKFPLLVKDWLSVTRQPSETGYGLFLSSVAVFFFVFVSFGTRGGFRQDIWRVQLTVFAFGWLLFFTIAYFLRFLYPLTGQDGKNAWHLFTMPVTRKQLLLSKLQAAGTVSVIPCLFAFAVWQMLPFAAGFRFILSAMSIVSIITLAVVQTLLGSLVPDFSKHATPEKASTSSMGLVTLGASVLIAWISGSLLSRMLTGDVNALLGISAVTVCETCISLALWNAAYSSARRYELP